ncbi:MAG: transposase-like zinc-binding domain-containing protein [Bdellovibrionales bacterium]
MNCPKCLCAKAVKNGIVRSKQRYRCKSCGCNYTQSSLSRTPVDVRARCIEYYLEGVGFHEIGRLRHWCANIDFSSQTPLLSVMTRLVRVIHGLHA